MALIYTKYVWECLYSHNNEGTLVEGYFSDLPHVQTHAEKGTRYLQDVLQDGDSAVFVGCAFGNLMQGVRDLGFTEIVGIDNSPYIHANLSTQAPTEIASRIIDCGVGLDSEATISSALTDSFGRSTFDWVVDEDAVTAMHTDDEINAFLAGCEALLSGNQTERIVHFVSPLSPSGKKGDSGVNWKTKSEWEEYAPNHTWLTWAELT